ncbi:hypothetical protein L1887_23873 [Cichorium endivia]|nr:hypothetical protein L1887_23873 [Cichorium endivia]
MQPFYLSHMSHESCIDSGIKQEYPKGLFRCSCVREKVKRVESSSKHQRPTYHFIQGSKKLPSSKNLPHCHGISFLSLNTPSFSSISVTCLALPWRRYLGCVHRHRI